MSFPRYPKYKESAVEWLAEVPSHWDVKKTSHIADLLAGFAFPSDEFEFDPSAGIPLVRGDNVTEGCLRWGEKGRYWPYRCKYDDRYLLQANDIVIQMDGSKVGKNWALVTDDDLPALLVQRVTRVRVHEHSQKFVYSLFANEMFVRYVDQAKTDPAVPHITMRNIGDYWLPLPPLSEQISIVEFIDRETTKIDALVAEQRRLIEILKEQRQAIIVHAVTKGLNPHVPMKDSGIQWLGDVPTHWRIGRVKDFFKTCSGGTPNTDLQDLYYADEGSGIPWVRTTDLGNNVLSTCDVFITQQAIDDTACAILPVGTVMVAMYGGDGTVGKNGLLAISAAINQAICGLLPSETHSSEYVFRYMQFYRPYWMIGAESSRKDPNISQERVRNAPLPRPPRPEQDAIVEHLRFQLSSLDTLCTDTQRAIDLLLERRTALISAAVTGQIDVRQLADKQAAA